MFEDMEFCMCVPPDASLGTAREWWKEIERLGFDLIGVPDTPMMCREVYVSLAAIALDTSRAGVMLMSTNPVTRDISVAAGAILGLHELAGDRIQYVYAAGDSSTWGVGLASAKAKEIADHVSALRDILGGRTVTYRDRTLKASWRDWKPFRPNLLMAASGEKSLRAAGRVADGVIAAFGLLPETITRANELIAEGAREVGRDPSEIKIWHMVTVVPAPTVEEGFARSGLASQGKMLLHGGAAGKMLPPNVEAALREAAAAYSLDAHARSNDEIVEIAKRTGTMEYLVARAGGLIGPVDVTAGVSRLRSYGVQNLIMVGLAEDKLGTIRNLAAATVAKRGKAQ